MYSSKKKAIEEAPIEVTAIWSCSNEDCTVWMRDNFTFSVAPVCTQCHSVMVKTERDLGVLENNSPITTKKI